MKKKLFVCILTLCILMLSSVAVYAAEGCNHGYTPVENEAQLPKTSGQYCLTADIGLTDNWVIPEGEKITLCLNGHTLALNDDWNMVVHQLTVNGNLTICDHKDANGEYQGQITGKSNFYAVYVYGKMTVNGGKVTGVVSNNSVITGAGGIQVEGELILNDGEISYNEATYGGGVYVKGPYAIFQMNGGTVKGNKTLFNIGGGIFVYQGTCVINGGVIEGNEANTERGYKGGGIAVDGGGRAVLNGGTIKNNSAKIGGGVAVLNGKFEQYGGVIEGNTANEGAGVYLGEKGWYYRCEGDVINNKAEKSGGGVHVEGDYEYYDGKTTGNIATVGAGVYFNAGTIKMESRPYVKDNFDIEGAENNVYLKAGKTITLTGELKDDALIGVTLEEGTGVAAKAGNGEVKAGQEYCFRGDVYEYMADIVNGEVYIGLHKHGETVYTPISDIVKTSGYYVLEEDIYVFDSWDIDEGVTMHICLNGHSIKKDGNAKESIIMYISGGAKLYICDCKGTGKITGGTEMHAAVFARGDFYMDSGSITGNYIGVSFDNGSVNLSGTPVIIGNSKYDCDLSAGKVLNITGELKEGALIRVNTWSTPDENGDYIVARLPLGSTYNFEPYFVSAHEGMSVIQEGGAIKLTSRHTHKYTYSLNEAGDTITETCVATLNPCGYSASVTISAPENLVYDKNSHDAVLTGEISEELTISYTRDGNPVESTVEAGKYVASVTVRKTTAKVEYTVEAMEIDPPAKDTQTYVYSGNPHTYKLPENEWYSVTGATKVEAGTYEVTVALKDKLNTVWSDKTTADKIYTFNIEKALQNITLNAPVAENVGTESVTLKEVTVVGGVGNIQYAVSLSRYTPTEGWQESPVFTGLNPGTVYYFFVRCAGDNNYHAVYSSGTPVRTTGVHIVEIDTDGKPVENESNPNTGAPVNNAVSIAAAITVLGAAAYVFGKRK